MNGTFDAAQRRALQDALREGDDVGCPACGAPLSTRPVQPPSAVAYVRRRVWVLCTGCRRSASVDVDVEKPRR